MPRMQALNAFPYDGVDYQPGEVFDAADVYVPFLVASGLATQVADVHAAHTPPTPAAHDEPPPAPKRKRA